ncbi:MAG: hypothetical protein ABI443_09845 [Chthoniobacterales bacterium]
MRYYLKISSIFSSSKFFPALALYGSGLGLLALTCICISHVYGLHVASWTAGFPIPVVVLSFLLCAAAPFLTPCRKSDRWLLLGIGLVIFGLWFAVCAITYTSVVSAAHSSEGAQFRHRGD